MSESNPIRVFATHAWERDDDDYLRLFEYLESTTNFYYRNVCDPGKAPHGESVADRRTRVVDGMREAEVLVVLAGQYEQHRDWVDFEITAAKAHDIPIIVVEPFGPHELQNDLKEHADAIVGWNSRTIEDAIRMQARHDDTKRFDMIDFDLS